MIKWILAVALISSELPGPAWVCSDAGFKVPQCSMVRLEVHHGGLAAEMYRRMIDFFITSTSQVNSAPGRNSQQ